jgi:ABC-type amino acid transport substrate-binding protein
MKLLQFLFVTIVGAAVAVVGLHVVHWDSASQGRLVSQPAFDRVMKTHTLRCAYNNAAGYFTTIDADRGVAIGIAHDVVEQMGHILNLKIEWVEEAIPAQAGQNLADGREDVMCFPMWPDGPHAATLDYTAPLDYMPVYAYVRADDTRFDGDLTKINDSGVIVSVIRDGESKTIADEDFSQAAQYSVIDAIDRPHLLLAVTMKRADVAFVDPIAAEDFRRNNPGTLKQVANVAALRVSGESFAVGKGETKLRDMLNVALAQMQQDGFIRATLDKYLGDHKGEFFYVAKPWE